MARDAHRKDRSRGAPAALGIQALPFPEPVESLVFLLLAVLIGLLLLEIFRWHMPRKK